MSRKTEEPPSGAQATSGPVSELKFSCGICGRYMDKPCTHWSAWIANPQPIQPVTAATSGTALEIARKLSPCARHERCGCSPQEESSCYGCLLAQRIAQAIEERERAVEHSLIAACDSEGYIHRSEIAAATRGNKNDKK